MQFVTYFVLPVLTFWCLYIKTVTGNPQLLWSAERTEFRSSGIYLAPALPSQQRTSGGFIFSKRILSLKLPHFIGSVDSNDAKGQIAIMDVGRGNLAIVSKQTHSILRYHKGLTKQATAVSIDWTTGNIYWTDQGHKWLFVSTSDFNHSTVVVPNVAAPRGIAVYPQKGLLFWSELGDGMGSSKIMRSSLSGEKPTTVVATVGTPSAISIDYENEKLYWIDKSSMAIYQVDVYGKTTYQMLFAKSTMVLEDLHVFRDWIYVTANNVNQILMLNKTTGDVIRTIRTHLPTAVTVVGGDAQPNTPGPCDIKNGGCEHFCFPQPPGNLRKCGCSLGMDLGSDGTSCVSKLMKDNFHLVVDSDMRWIFQVSADGQRYTKLNLSGLNIPVQTQYDPETKRVYWTDIGSSSVNRADLDGSNHVVIAKTNVRQPTGLALDRYSKNLYWTDEGTGTINVVRTDGKHRKTLLSNFTLPRGLVVDPTLGYMWWSDWGRNTIEMANMDGSGRKVIVDEGVEWVNGLALDYSASKLYWCDAKKDTIEMADMDGENRQVVKKFDDNDTHVFGIDTSDDFIYWTDWSRPSVMRMRKNTPERVVQEFGPQIFEKASDVHSFTGSKTAPLENGTSPCQDANGNCTGLCIPLPKNRTSLNAINGENDIYLTSRICLCGNEQQDKDCDKPSNSTDGIAPTFNGTCPGPMTFVAPRCGSKVLVNYKMPAASDNSGEVRLETPARPPPVNLTEGEYEHRYTAVDAAGNHDTCAVLISVKVIRCGSPEEYLKERRAKATSFSCDDFYGSQVLVDCVNGTSMDEQQFLECENDGKWSGEPVCFYSEPIDEDDETTTPPDPESTMLPTEAVQTTKTPPSVADPKHRNVEDTSPFNLSLIIPVAVAIAVIIMAAIAYWCYRSNSMPLLAAMEKTLSYRNDDANRDTFTLDVAKSPGPSEPGSGNGEETFPRSSAQTEEGRTSGSSIAIDARSARSSSYGTIS